MVVAEVMSNKMTAKPSTARMETTLQTSSKWPSPTELESTQTPKEPEVGYLEKTKEAAIMSGRYYEQSVDDNLNSVKLY